MIRAGIAAALLVSAAFILPAKPGRAADVASANDTARLIAGMPPAAGSPLLPLTQVPAWQQHAQALDASFASVETRQLSKIRLWSHANLTAPKPVLFYMFSGPDFLYANEFFPSASIYVLSGLEPVGQIPDLLSLKPAALIGAVNGIRRSLRSVLSSSFFITSHMGHDLSGSVLHGTLPVLYVFLVRTGHSIQDMTLVSLDDHGEVTKNVGGNTKAVPGVKIVFSDQDGRASTLYYFKTNLANDGFKDSAFEQFCNRFNEGDSFVKSASYLLHGNNFSQVRRFLLDHSATIVQDDTGIPVGLYDTSQWQVRPFGNYVAPIPIFSSMYQPKMRRLFISEHPSPIDFGIGYRWRPSQSSLLVATKKATLSAQ